MSIQTVRKSTQIGPFFFIKGIFDITMSMHSESNHFNQLTFFLMIVASV